MSSDIPAADVAAAVDVIFQYQFVRPLVVLTLRRIEILFNILIFIKQIPQEDWNEYGYCDVITSGDHVRGIENFTSHQLSVSQSEPAWAGSLLHRPIPPTLPATPHQHSHLFGFRGDGNRTGPPPHPNPTPSPLPLPPLSSHFYLFLSPGIRHGWVTQDLRNYV